MDRFEPLLDQYLSGLQSAELERLLQADAALRRQLVDRFVLEVQLYKAFAGVTSSLPAQREDRPDRLPVFRWLVAALVLLAVGLALFLSVGRNATPLANEVLAGEVRLDGVAVKRLPEDRWFEVGPEAPALIRLADGSDAEMAPTSKSQIRSGGQNGRLAVELERGAGRFKVTAKGGQFRVDTPRGSVIALGTEFSVKLETRGKRGGKGKPVLSVVVLEGSVKVDTGGKSYVLAAGERQTFSERGGREEEDDD